MEHYVCTGGCGGVSGTPGVCQTEGCPNFGKPLALCGCGDGEHAEVKEREETAKMSEMESEEGTAGSGESEE